MSTTRTNNSGFGARFGAWRDQHVYSLLSSLGRIASKPFSTFLIVGVMAIAMAMPLALGMVLINVQRVSGTVQAAREMSVFLKPEVTLDQANALAKKLEQRGDVEKVTVVSPDEGLAEFRKLSDLAQSIDLLGSNPLPSVLKIRPKDDGMALAEALQQWPEADVVQHDGQWRQRLNAWLSLGERMLKILSILFGVGVLLVVGNTVRLDIGTRREEIAVMQQLGATDGFIRRPFLYLGFWYGLAAGALALALSLFAGLALDERLRPLLASYDSRFALQGPDLTMVLALLAGSAILGWMGAWLASGHHLRQTRPTDL
ncbi:MAG TPA: permease-like cell division protein FtsX [Arenimonas sp.]|nr:permease-like cell division protein FtsX [Arenimonas sp.]